MMKKEQNTRSMKIREYVNLKQGITLIALVVTIIILLILTGITINLTMGQTGILARAKEAGKNYTQATKQEEKDLEKLYSSIKVAGDSQVTLTMEELDAYIQEKMQNMSKPRKSTLLFEGNATTENINLSKKVSDEMVIYIFTKTEYQKKTTCNITNSFTGEISEEIEKKESLIETNKEENTTEKVSLNKATKEELMTLEGIGESKALSIIEYRTKKDGFQTLEELKNVNGIGESLYEKIKNNITL